MHGVFPASSSSGGAANQLPSQKSRGDSLLNNRRMWMNVGSVGLLFAVLLIIWVVVNKIKNLEGLSASPTTTLSIPPTRQKSTSIIETPIIDTPMVTSQVETLITSTALPARIDSIDGQMVLVPAGSFSMGGNADDALRECNKLIPDPQNSCTGDQFFDEERIHEVKLDSFYIDVYEVTNARYLECVDAGVCDAPAGKTSNSRPNLPVVNITWLMARRYCEAWRNARLQFEAEWEKAARGKNETLYPWGSDFDGTMANFCDVNCVKEWKNGAYDDGYSELAPIGSYKANGYGIYDMAGNAQEWVQDWYSPSYYNNSPSENPEGPDFGDRRVIRGGSWFNGGDSLRTSRRFSESPDYYSDSIGFRCSYSP